jgi:hypothetical protein
MVPVLGSAVSADPVSGVLGASLYPDTVFTVALSFAFGLWPGLVTGVLLYPGTNILYKLILRAELNTFRAGNVFTFCTLSEILPVCFFRAGIRQGRSLFLEEPSLSSFAGIAALK